jgi:beta-galactosidase
MLNGDPSDFVIPGDDLSGYKLLQVSAMELVDRKTAEWFKDYVKKGGNLLVEYPFACRDEQTWVTPKRPGHGLETLLGCFEGERHMIGEEDIAAVFGMNIPAGSGNLKDWASRWYVELKPCGGKVIGKWQDGKPAMIKNKYGKGTVWTTGFNASLAFKDTWDDPSLKYFRALMSDAGVTPLPWAGKGIFLMKRKGNSGTIIFVFNNSDKKQSITLPVKPSVKIESESAVVSGKELKMGPKGIFVALME